MLCIYLLQVVGAEWCFCSLQISGHHTFAGIVASGSDGEKVAAIEPVLHVDLEFHAKITGIRYISGDNKPLQFACSIIEVSQLDGTDLAGQQSSVLGATCPLTSAPLRLPCMSSCSMHTYDHACSAA